MSDQLTDRLIEAKKYHLANLKYADCFSYKITLSLLLLDHKSFKIRIFDSFFKKSELYYFVGTNIYLTPKKYVNSSNWQPNLPNKKYENVALYTGFREDQGMFIQYRLCGYYIKGNHYVLCTMPHAKTLLKSYENNKESTLLKLTNFCPSPIKAIQAAKILVETNG